MAKSEEKTPFDKFDEKYFKVVEAINTYFEDHSGEDLENRENREKVREIGKTFAEVKKMLEDYVPPARYQAYPTMLKHFSKIADKLAKNPLHYRTEKAVRKEFNQLNDALGLNPPLPKPLKVSIAAFFGALVGGTIGCAVGVVASFYLGGAAAPLTTGIGALVGSTLTKALIGGGLLLGMGTLGLGGYFLGKRSEQKHKDAPDAYNEVVGKDNDPINDFKNALMPSPKK